MRSYDELRFRDDFMFGKVMEDPELCRELLECLLQQPVGELTRIQTQKQIRYTKDGKPIRLDVYSEESLDEERHGEEDMGKVYDTEMHNLNHKKVEEHQLPKRSRYYQGAIDVNYLGKGVSFKKLPESTVIFVCTFDPFGLGLSQYTFSENCEEDNGLKLLDGTRKIFYNCTYAGTDIPEDLRMLYDYVETGKAENELTKKAGVEMDPKTRGPKVDPKTMATRAPGVFAGGNVVRVYDLVDWVSRDSEIAGRNAAAYALGTVV